MEKTERIMKNSRTVKIKCSDCMEFEEVENIGQRIKEIRKSKSITIQKLSQFTDLSVGYLSNLERNQASPTLNNLQIMDDSV